MAVPFQCVVEPDRDVAVVSLSGELDLATAPKVATCVRELVEADFRSVKVDLTGVTFIDSTGLRTLVEASRFADQYDAALTLIAGPDAVQRAFTLTGLDRCLTFEPPPPAPQRPQQRWAAAQSVRSAVAST